MSRREMPISPPFVKCCSWDDSSARSTFSEHRGEHPPMPTRFKRFAQAGLVRQWTSIFCILKVITLLGFKIFRTLPESHLNFSWSRYWAIRQPTWPLEEAVLTSCWRSTGSNTQPKTWPRTTSNFEVVSCWYFYLGRSPVEWLHRIQGLRARVFHHL